MSLRPRYSLLTLLILTALVAGGLQYWRGPHWRTLSEPLTAADQALLAGPYYANPELQLLFHGDVRCKYRNTLAGPELLLIHGQPAVNAPLFVKSGYVALRVVSDDSWHFIQGARRYVSPEASSTSAPYPRETIRSWYSQPRQAAPKPEVTEITGSLEPIAYTVIPPNLPQMYFVTEQKRVFQLLNNSLAVTPIPAAEIDEPELRALIEAELANIPDPR